MTSAVPPSVLRGLALAMVLGASFAVVRWTPLRKELDPRAIVERLRNAEPYSGIAYVAGCFIGILVLAPDTALNFIGAVVFGPVLGTLLSWAGVMLGSYAAFALARRLGRNAFVGLAGDKLRRLDEIVKERGLWGMLAIRLFPLASYSVVSYLAGLTSVRTSDYLAATAVATLPVTFAYQLFFSWAGETAFGSDAHAHLHLVNILLVLALLLVHLASAAWFALLHRADRRAARSRELAP